MGNFSRHKQTCELNVASAFRTYIALLQNYGGSKQKSYKIMQMQVFATQGISKVHTEYKRLKLGGGQAYDG